MSNQGIPEMEGSPREMDDKDRIGGGPEEEIRGVGDEEDDVDEADELDEEDEEEEDEGSI